MKRVIVLLAMTVCACIARADNAVPIAVRDDGNTRVLLFSHQTPIRAGLVSLSLMAIDLESGKPLGDLQVSGSLHPVSVRDDSGRAWVPTYCRIDSRTAPDGGVLVDFGSSKNANPFAREASLILAKSGDWRLDVTMKLPGDRRATIGFPIQVAAARPALARYWPWFAALPLAVGVFAWSRPAYSPESARSTSRAI